MRIVMPLFGFESMKNQSYSFGDSGIAIQPLKEDGWDFTCHEGLSAQDIERIRSVSWAIIYNGSDQKYMPLINYLLMAFRIFSDHRPPNIKYGFCKESNQCSNNIDPMTINPRADKEPVPYDSKDIEKIDAGFQHLREMDSLSTRTHNALYFLYRAFHADKWIDSFVLMVCSLESLFSKDKPGGATDAITTRVSSLLGSQARCTKNDLKHLYDLRSAMTHGRLEARDDVGENLRDLEHLEFVVVHCFRELVNRRSYEYYASKSERDKFMGTLNNVGNG